VRYSSLGPQGSAAGDERAVSLDGFGRVDG
jgi:hypothetical protein